MWTDNEVEFILNIALEYIGNKTAAKCTCGLHRSRRVDGHLPGHV